MRLRRIFAAAALGVLLAAAIGVGTAQADTIGGHVYVNAGADTFSPAEGDMPVPGMNVKLEKQTPDPMQPTGFRWDPVPGGFVPSMADGSYTFGNREAGRYRVTLPDLAFFPFNGQSLHSTAVVINEMVMPLPEPTQMPEAGPVDSTGDVGGEQSADFPLVLQGSEDPTITSESDILARVFADVGTCDGAYDPGADQLLSGRMVRLRTTTATGTTELFETTDANGDVTFAGVLTATSQDALPTYTIAAEQGDGTFGADEEIVITFIPGFSFPPVIVPDTYSYTQPTLLGGCNEGGISGRVWVEANPANGTYEDGSDVVEAGVTVRLFGAGGVAMGTTNTFADGTYTFGALAPATYEVRSDAPSTAGTADLLRVVTVHGTSETADFPWPGKTIVVPPTCVHESATRGEMHEVLLEVEVWVGSAPPASIAASAGLYQGCRNTSGEIDIASIGYLGTTFPGNAGGLGEGLNGVLRIEDVRVASGWATVRVRMTANPAILPAGGFGMDIRKLEVSLNGRRETVCWRWRNETTRPGGRAGFFRVLETWSQASWAACEGMVGEPPVIEPPVIEPPVIEPPAPPPPPAPLPPRHAKSDKSGKSHKSHKSHKSGKSAKPRKKARKASKAKAGKKKVRKARKQARRSHGKKARRGGRRGRGMSSLRALLLRLLGR